MGTNREAPIARHQLLEPMSGINLTDSILGINCLNYNIFNQIYVVVVLSCCPTWTTEISGFCRRRIAKNIKRHFSGECGINQYRRSVRFRIVGQLSIKGNYFARESFNYSLELENAAKRDPSTLCLPKK